MCILSLVLRLLLVLPHFLFTETETATPQFRIDYDNNQFLRDGEPFRYVSGSLHYFRVPSVYWRDRMRKYRAAGLNAICTYVEWSQHEPFSGQYDFSGELDLARFIKMAQEEDLLVLLRPGPYICAERDMGGLPPWMVTEHPDIKLRTSDANYQHYISRWFSKLMPVVEPLLYGKGGPIILVQVENEYGSYIACDRNHTAWLRDLFESYIGDNAVLFTTDGAGTSYLRCGKIDGVYATVDFGTVTNVTRAFLPMREYEPAGPLVNSEFYPGWLTHWGEKFQTVSTAAAARTLNDILALGACVNIYMFHGGTNFGFTSGANYGSRYEPQITSYDYDAPMTEAGDPTDKYFALREVIGRYMPLPNTTVPGPMEKGDYGRIQMSPVASLLDDRVLAVISTKNVTGSVYPLTFEQLRHKQGFVLYIVTVPYNVALDPAVLDVKQIGDRAYVFKNKVFQGILSRIYNITVMSLQAKGGDTLQILVENLGRINYGSKIKDIKGLLSPNVTLSQHVLTNWTMMTLPLHTVKPVVDLSDGGQASVPAFFKASFVLPDSNCTMDTFLDTTGWSKGVAFVNDHNLGRYWPRIGPQVTLFVPAYFLLPYPQTNEVVMFELEEAPTNLSISFVKEPYLNATVTPTASFYDGGDVPMYIY